MRAKYLRRSAAVAVVAAMLAALSLVLVPARAAGAAEWREDTEVIIGAGEVVDGDLFVNTDLLIIEGTVQGDVFGYAYEARLSGTVEGDVLLVGHELTITGAVNDDVRAAFVAMRLVEGATVQGDFFGAGFAFALDAESAVQGDLAYVGYQADVAGNVEGDLHADVVALRVAGAVAGAVDARVQAYGAVSGWPLRFSLETPVALLPAGLEVAETASVGGAFTYTSAEAFPVSERAVAGEITYREGASFFGPSLISTAYGVVNSLEQRGWAGTLALGWLALFASRLLTLLIVGLVVTWRAPRLLRLASAQLRKRSMVSLFIGLALLVVTPFALAVVAVILLLIVAVLTAVTLGGLSVAALWTGLLSFGALLTAAYLAFGFIAPLVVAFAIGQYALRRLTQAAQPNRVAAMLVGVAGFVILWQIPIFGECFNCLSVMLGIGALFFYWRNRNRDLEAETDTSLAWLAGEPEPAYVGEPAAPEAPAVAEAPAEPPPAVETPDIEIGAEAPQEPAEAEAPPPDEAPDRAGEPEAPEDAPDQDD
ncbi:MAG: hypothetical protein Kow00120_29450 [Anaerolineae bacterium]